jgi:hypothetical protein
VSWRYVRREKGERFVGKPNGNPTRSDLRAFDLGQDRLRRNQDRAQWSFKASQRSESRRLSLNARPAPRFD